MLGLRSRRDRNPFGSLLAGPGGLVAGGDLILERFGWASQNGQVANVLGLTADNAIVTADSTLYTADGFAPGQVLGFILPEPIKRWDRLYSACDTYGERVQVLRSGGKVTLLSYGDVWVKFPAGAQIGNAVFANILDGTPISQPLTADNTIITADDTYLTADNDSVIGQLTPWFVVTNAGAGEYALISTFPIFN